MGLRAYIRVFCFFVVAYIWGAEVLFVSHTYIWGCVVFEFLFFACLPMVLRASFCFVLFILLANLLGLRAY